MSYNEGEPSPKGTFSTYLAEADQLFLKGKFAKAIESYSMALIKQPDDKNCLAARSKCFLKMGFPENALKDAEAVLKQDNEFYKGLYRKAEALYTMGDFEFALVFYHRGHRLRPELQEFRLGIQKAQEAIINCVGCPSFVQLENKGDLSFFKKSDEVRPKPFIHLLNKDRKQQRPKTGRTEKTAKVLLGKLYSDKEYLQQLMKDEDLIKSKTRRGEQVENLIFNCISYLDTRSEFWQQQKPIYSRQCDRMLLEHQWNRTENASSPETTSYILKNLEDIDEALATGNPKSGLRKAREVLKIVQDWSVTVLPNKAEVLGNLYSCIGNALMDLGDMDKALNNHQKDLELAEQCKSMESKSRALDNIGRVYARIGKFPQAIEAWEAKIPLVQSGLEKAWLFHETGRCYLELKHYKKAKDYGIRSLHAAYDIRDKKWQLNASVLVAQAELKLGNFEASVFNFEKALEQAKLLHDDAARDCIQKALQDMQVKK